MLTLLEQSDPETTLALMLQQLPDVTEFRFKTDGKAHQVDFLPQLITVIQRPTDLHTLFACLGDSSDSDVTVDDMVQFFEALAVRNTVEKVQLREEVFRGDLRLSGQLDNQHRLRLSTAFERLTSLQVFIWTGFCVEPMDTFFDALTACSSLQYIEVKLVQDLPCTRSFVDFFRWCLSSDSVTFLKIECTRGFSLRFTEPSTTIAALELFYQKRKGFILELTAITFDYLDYQVAGAWVKAVTSSSLELQLGCVVFPRDRWSGWSAEPFNPKTNDQVWESIHADLTGAYDIYRKNRADSARAMLKLGRYFMRNTDPETRKVCLKILEYTASHLTRDEFLSIVKALEFRRVVATGADGTDLEADNNVRFLNVIDNKYNTYTLAYQLAVKCE
ncbi:hypothetical protein HK102_009864, partial [Quaeritorhiza haematococci]